MLYIISSSAFLKRTRVQSPLPTSTEITSIFTSESSVDMRSVVNWINKQMWKDIGKRTHRGKFYAITTQKNNKLFISIIRTKNHFFYVFHRKHNKYCLKKREKKILIWFFVYLHMRIWCVFFSKKSYLLPKKSGLFSNDFLCESHGKLWD